MRPRFSIVACLFSIFSPASAAAECKPRAISLPFKDSLLASRGRARGIAWQIGGPSKQTIALLPSATYNDTYMFGSTGACTANITTEKCTTVHGGLFDSALSDSEVSGAAMTRGPDDMLETWMADKISIQDSTDKVLDLGSQGFGIRNNIYASDKAQDWVVKGELGLGRNSTFMNVLAAGQKVASRTYSFFWGVDPAITDNPRDGSLTVGGYDQALIGDAKNVTTKFTRDQPKCPEGMVVSLTGLALQSAGAGIQNVMEQAESIQACVVPSLSSTLTLPMPLWNVLASKMRVQLSPLNGGYSGALFYRFASIRPASATFDGNLTVTLNNALAVTIPNDQLLFDEPFIPSTGIVKRNTDWKNIPIVRYADTDQEMPKIGGMFFSSAYLMVNHDKDEFTISGVQGTPAAQKLVGIDTANDCVESVDGGSSTVPEPSTHATSPADPSKGLSGGAVAGIVVGVVLLLAALAGIAFLAWRRRREPTIAPYRGELAASFDHGAISENDGASIVEKYGMNVSEMYAGQVHGHGLSAPMHARPQVYAVELDGRGRPAEVSVHGAEIEHLIRGER